MAPDQVAETVPEIDLEALASRGIKALLLDVDNTLVPWGSCEMAEATESWVMRAKQSFAICLLSNSVRGRRMRALSKGLDVPGFSVWGAGRKPLAGGFLRAAREVNTDPNKTAMIGDQLLADVLGGNRVGMYTVWVKPISDSEFITTRLGRVLERACVRRLRRAGLLGHLKSS